MKKGKKIVGYNPETGEPIFEEVVEQPVVEQPVVEQPVVEQPAAPVEQPVEPVVPTVPVQPVKPVKRRKKDIIGYNPETGEPIYKEIVPGEKPKKSKKGLIITLIILLILIAAGVVVTVLLLNNKGDKLSDEEYQTIITDYGKAAERAAARYMDEEEDIPSLKDIKKDIFYNEYEVECDTFKVNYDATVYIASCSVDGKKISSDITYGRKKEKPPVDETITIYKNDYETYNYYFIYDEYKNTSKNSINDKTTTYAEYNCENEGCFGYRYYDKLDILVLNDNGVYVYNFKTKKKNKLKDVNKNIDDIFMLTDSNDEIVGFFVVDEDEAEDSSYTAAFYNYKKQKYVTDFKYYGSTGRLLNDKYVVGINDGVNYVLDLDGNEVFNTSEYKGASIGYSEGYYFITTPFFSSNASPVIALNDNFEEFIKDFEKYDAAALSNGNILVVEMKTDENDSVVFTNKYYIYNKSGKQLSESKEYDKIYLIIPGYVVASKDNKVYFVDVANNKEIEMFELTDAMKFHTALSGWWKKDGKENGVWVVVEDTSVAEGTEGRGLEYYYIPKTGETGVVKIKQIGGYAKPVLYLYPEEETEVSIDFAHPEYLTTTYPKFTTNWKVLAKPNGDLYDNNGKYYYGLYWEEDGTTEVDFKTGFYVTKENAIDFLEEKLSIIGLNDRERNEFIMYWLPILEKNEKNLVYFELTEQRDIFNKLIINPVPDSLLRVAIHVKKVDEEVNIKEQELPHFERKGFTAVEWGGVIH